MKNPKQETILLEQAYDELDAIWTKFQEQSGATVMEVKLYLENLWGFMKKILLTTTT